MKAAMAPQVALGEGTSESVERVVGMRDGNASHGHEHNARHAGRLGTDREVDPALREHLLGAGEHRLEDLDARLGALARELGEALEQQPRRKQDLDRDPDLGLPFHRHFRSTALERRGILQQGARAPVEHLSRLREHRLAAADLEDLEVQQTLDLLHRVGDRRLALVERGRRRRPPPRPAARAIARG